MKVSQEEVVESQTVLHIELEPPDVDKYLDRVYRRVVQKTTVPGFRRGKAPRALLERFIGREVMLEEALDFMVPEVTAEAVEQQGLETAGLPKVEIVQLDPAVQLKATVPLKPAVELGDYRDLRLEEETVEITEEQIEEGLQQIRRESAPWEPVERPVQWDDMVTLSVIGQVNGREVLKDNDGLYIPQKDSENPIPGFSQELIGIAKGETKSFKLPVPEDYPDSTAAGHECEFSVSVAEIKERKPPELDDEFAKGVGEGYETLEALRQRVGDDLRSHAEGEARQRYQEKVVEALLENAQMELPPLLIEHEIDHLLNEQERALQQQRVSTEEYLSNVGKTPEQLREELRQVAIQRLHRSVTLSAIAELEEIEVSEDEIEARVASMSPSSSERGEELRQLFGSDEGRSTLGRMLLNQKLLDRLVEIARGEAEASEQTSDTNLSSEPSKEEEEPDKGGTENAE